MTMKREEPYVNITFRVRKSIRTDLLIIAGQRNERLSDLMRQIVKDYLKQTRKKSPKIEKM